MPNARSFGVFVTLRNFEKSHSTAMIFAARLHGAHVKGAFVSVRSQTVCLPARPTDAAPPRKILPWTRLFCHELVGGSSRQSREPLLSSTSTSCLPLIHSVSQSPSANIWRPSVGDHFKSWGRHGLRNRQQPSGQLLAHSRRPHASTIAFPLRRTQ